MVKVNIILNRQEGAFRFSDLEWRWPSGLTLFDKLYAYRQSLNPNFESDVEIEFNGRYTPDAFNILFINMPHDVVQLEHEEQWNKVDLTVLDNSSEPISTTNTPLLVDRLDHGHTRTLIQTNSVFAGEKTHLNKNIVPWMDCVEIFRDNFSRSISPLYYLPHTQYTRNSTVCYINGDNRANRHHFATVLHKLDPDIHYVNQISGTGEIRALHDCSSVIEDSYDTEFRKFVNREYSAQTDLPNNYWRVGIGPYGKNGTLNIGFFPLSEYFKHSVVAYPECPWVNSEIEITEKALKCFYYGCLPFPVAGAQINSMYEHFGFRTAWHLLPEEHQTFDQEMDHRVRYVAAAEALVWLSKNPEILTGDRYHHLIEHNQRAISRFRPEQDSILKINNFIEQFRS